MHGETSKNPWWPLLGVTEMAQYGESLKITNQEKDQ